MGFFPHPVGLLAGGVVSIAQVLSATSTGSTINFPGGIQAGDLIVLCDMAESGAAPTAVTPSGFSVIANNTTGIRRMMLTYKKADGTESGALTGMNGSSNNAKVMVIFRGTGAAATITSHDHDGFADGGDPPAQTITSGSGLAPLVAIAGYGNSSAVTARPFSPAKDGEVGSSGDRCYVAWKIYNTGPSDITVDQTDIGQPFVATCYFQLS